MIIDTPRERVGRFERAHVAKGQIRFTGMDGQIPILHVCGMSTRDFVAVFQDMYGA